MIYKLYSYKDKKINRFMPPIPYLEEEYAIRAFQLDLTTKNHLRMIKDDLQLWYLGSFDDASGTVITDKNTMELTMEGAGVDVNKIQNSLQSSN